MKRARTPTSTSCQMTPTLAVEGIAGIVYTYPDTEIVRAASSATKFLETVLGIHLDPEETVQTLHKLNIGIMRGSDQTRVNIRIVSMPLKNHSTVWIRIGQNGFVTLYPEDEEPVSHIILIAALASMPCSHRFIRWSNLTIQIGINSANPFRIVSSNGLLSLTGRSKTPQPQPTHTAEILPDKT